MYLIENFKIDLIEKCFCEFETNECFVFQRTIHNYWGQATLQKPMIMELTE